MNNPKKTILLIDDDANDRLIMERCLRKFGGAATIHVLNDGLEAIAYINGDGKFADREQYAYPTFIITDLKMPHADGFAVLQHLKGNAAWSVIPTIVFSSSLDPEHVQAAYRLGASSYQPKAGDYGTLTEQMKVVHAYWMNCLTPSAGESRTSASLLQ
jgi:CheY-like chemotaxis protein